MITRRHHLEVLARMQADHDEQVRALIAAHTLEHAREAPARLERRADAFDLEADIGDRRPPGGPRKVETLSPSARRAVADELRTVARDVESNVR